MVQIIIPCINQHEGLEMTSDVSGCIEVIQDYFVIYVPIPPHSYPTITNVPHVLGVLNR